MGLIELKEALRLIHDNSAIADFEGEITADRVASAESLLGLSLPPSYREFIMRLGCGNIGGHEFYGILKGDCTCAVAPNAIGVTLRQRMIGGLPESLVLVSDNGAGGWYAIETSTRDSDGESPVIEWWGAGCDSEIVALDFGSFLLQRVREACE